MVTAIKSTELKMNTKNVCDRAYSGETLIISRPKDQNVVLISEQLYHELERYKRNSEYLAALDRGNREIAEGKLIYKTLDELEE